MNTAEFRERAQVWQVHLLVDGAEVVDEVTISPPFGIACADAEVKAIKAAETRGGKNVRCTRSRCIGYVNPRLVEVPLPLADRLEDLAAQFAERTGDSIESARRAVIQSVLARGILGVAKELDSVAPAVRERAAE